MVESTAFWLRDIVQKDEKVFGGGVGGKVVVMKEGSENEETEEVD